jgi:hypothetical protein
MTWSRILSKFTLETRPVWFVTKTRKIILYIRVLINLECQLFRNTEVKNITFREIYIAYDLH